MCLSKNVFLVSLKLSHPLQGCLCQFLVHVAQVFEDVQHCLANLLRHLHLPADVNISAFLLPQVKHLGSISPHQVLDILLGLARHSREGKLSLKIKQLTI